MTSHCQRWRDRRASFRLAGELFDPRPATVDAIDESTAKAFVLQHHYAASYPAARFRAGLFIGTRLSGVAVFSVPINPRTVPCYFDGLDQNAGVELGRLVLLDDVASNAESWFCARAFRLVRAALAVDGVVSYSDPVPRTTATGQVIKPGHVGIIYQALNACYHGRASASMLTLARNGQIVSRRAVSKLRNDECGAGYAYDQLLNLGAPARRPFESGADYVARALASEAFRRVRHPGNHAYTWWLGDKRCAPETSSLAYPKGEQLL